jgi:3-hydroxybutyryl-CoA dehydrogenase
MNTINKVAVMGAGMMGAEIALSFALHDIDVILKDVSLDLSSAGKQRIEEILNKWESKGKIDNQKKLSVLGRIIPQDDFSGFDEVDLVLEAIIEDIKIKNLVFEELEGVCEKECIFASNTSSIPISSLAGCTSRPSLFVGMHFFSPASIMKLVEIIPGIDTEEDTIKTVTDLVKKIEKEPVVVSDKAGFLVNRLLFAFFNEAWRMVDEGAATPEDIDRAVKLGLGHPLGPFQMQDLVGLDNALYVTRILSEEYGERFKPAPVLKRKVAAKHIGRKVKKGWFDYNS